MEETTPSISVLTSLTLVCDSKRGLGNLTESTQTRPSRTSSPEMAWSFSLSRLFALEYWLIARVKAVRKPVRWVPPSGLAIELEKQRIWSVKPALYWITQSTKTSSFLPFKTIGLG